MSYLSFHIYKENVLISSPPEIENISILMLESHRTANSHREVPCHLKLHVMPTACSSKAEDIIGKS